MAKQRSLRAGARSDVRRCDVSYVGVLCSNVSGFLSSVTPLLNVLAVPSTCLARCLLIYFRSPLSAFFFAKYDRFLIPRFSGLSFKYSKLVRRAQSVCVSFVDARRAFSKRDKSPIFQGTSPCRERRGPRLGKHGCSSRLLRANGRCCALEAAEINFEHYRCRGAPRREANTLLA